MNMLEWLPIFLPALWLFAIYISDAIAAALGLVWMPADPLHDRLLKSRPSAGRACNSGRRRQPSLAGLGMAQLRGASFMHEAESPRSRLFCVCVRRKKHDISRQWPLFDFRRIPSLIPVQREAALSNFMTSALWVLPAREGCSEPIT